MKKRALIPDWCSSLWDDGGSPVRHQCVRDRHHTGKCRCVCKAER